MFFIFTYGQTALHVAIKNNKEIDEVLVSYGANINQKISKQKKNTLNYLNQIISFKTFIF